MALLKVEQRRNEIYSLFRYKKNFYALLVKKKKLKINFHNFEILKYSQRIFPFILKRAKLYFILLLTVSNNVSTFPSNIRRIIIRASGSIDRQQRSLIGMLHLRNICAKRESDTRLPKIISPQQWSVELLLIVLRTLHNEKFASRERFERSNARKRWSINFQRKKNAKCKEWREIPN